jgi:ATP-dependent RNA helicase RhlE
LKQELQNAVKKAGYEEATPIQEKTMPVILAGRDLIACAQTGTGKTAAFALPILQKLDNGEVRKLRSLVLTPTRELAVQIFENFKKYGRYLPLRAACIYGGAKQKPQMEALRRGCDVLIATPGRLMDYMNLGLVSLQGIEIFVLDEADRMLDMGFINDVRKIVGSMNADRQTLMFSATMPKEIEQLGRDLLTDPADVRVAPQSTAADTVEQKICFLNHADKLKVLTELLQKDEVTRAMVFTRTKHGADRVARTLTRNGIAAKAIHGDKTQGQRQSTLEGYKAGHFHVLVATDVASRGIDIPEISHVINFNLPQEAESYIHRIGRTGRAGESGIAITLCEEDELEQLADVEKILKRQIEELKTEYSVSLRGKTPVRTSGGRGGRSGAKNTAGNGSRRNAKNAASGRNASKNGTGRNSVSAGHGASAGRSASAGSRRKAAAEKGNMAAGHAPKTNVASGGAGTAGGSKKKNSGFGGRGRRDSGASMMFGRSGRRISGRGGYTSFGYGEVGEKAGGRSGAKSAGSFARKGKRNT